MKKGHLLRRLWLAFKVGISSFVVDSSPEVAHESSLGQGYISCRDTCEKASAQGLTVCEYVENLWNIRGQTQFVIDRLLRNGVIPPNGSRILEIGPGTGRYLERVLKLCRPESYEIYETALDWSDYLAQQHPVINRRADGCSLSGTESQSIDLIMAHGVFVYLPLIVSYSYFQEMWRVLKPRGAIVFDVISEVCVQENQLIKWLEKREWYPVHLPKGLVERLFIQHQLELLETFIVQYGPATSEYLVFKKRLC